MLREFQPTGGFINQPNIRAVRIDDKGVCHYVMKDGTIEQTGLAVFGNYRPTWTLQELQQLVNDGKWKETAVDAEAETREVPAPLEAQPENA
jgi:hypothetical protein